MWVWILELSFAGYVTSFLLFIWKGFNREGKLQPRAAGFWMLATVACFVVWLISLPRA